MRIHQLDNLLANQIAAGEVIDRPASVVKELVENSMDAGSKKIEVSIERGGEKLIRVRDDGQGIHPEDLPLSLVRHATSKIASYDDLIAVSSLGFRGEALASIASISRLTLTSMIAGQSTGFCIRTNNNGSGFDPIKPAAHPVGTTIEVVDLFYQTPARKKFLRKERTEFTYIEAMINRLALGNFSVGFYLTHNGKKILNAQACNNTIAKEKRISAILGDDFLSSSLNISMKDKGISLEGWIAEPTYTRAQSDMQYFYVNGRFIKDKIVAHAIREAFRDVLFHGRHPAYVLYLNIEPTQVDVNVHPTKHEVRFRDGQTVYAFLRRAVQTLLTSIKPAQPKMQPWPEHSSESPAQFSQQVNAQIQGYQRLHEPSEKVDVEHHGRPPISVGAQVPMLLTEQENVYQINNFPLGFAIGQLFETFILSESCSGFILVDMHAAHERILYEKLKKQFHGQVPASQQLLAPISVTIGSIDQEDFSELSSLLAHIGFEISLLSLTQVAVRSVPVILQKVDPKQLISDVISDLRSLSSSLRVNTEVNKILSSIACHAALRAPHALSISEMNAILRQMEETENSGCCNHGRPTWKQFTKSEVDRFFLRGQ